MPRLAFISDTHTLHRRLTQGFSDKPVDVLVHCGDFTANEARDKIHEIADFAEWCGMLRRKQYAKEVVVIAGNHDLWFDPRHPETVKRDDPTLPERCRNRFRDEGVVYLQDSGAKVGDVMFWGTPWTDRYYDWGFQIDHQGEADNILDRIPSGIDVLVTHGPPYGVRDFNAERTGPFSKTLLTTLDRVKPRICAFGHIHVGYGMTLLPNGVVCVNAAIAARPLNAPIIIDL